jgi:hypothetical protein
MQKSGDGYSWGFFNIWFFFSKRRTLSILFFFFFFKDDQKLGPRAKLIRVRLCGWSTKVVSVVYIFRLLRLKKEQHATRLLQSLPPKMSLIVVPHSFWVLPFFTTWLISFKIKQLEVQFFQIICNKSQP